jgi:hypothetical protein
VIALAAFGAGLAVGSVGNESTSSDTGRVATATDRSATAATPTPTEPPTPVVPKAEDFTLTVKTLEKTCFGSAGCSITYRIDVGYDGPTLDPSNTYEVVYEVRGGEDGPQINTLTVEGDQSSVDSEETISTSSASRKLTAVATSVDLRS